MNLASSPNLIDREAAYLAARERIFGMDEGELKEAERQRPRNVPVVARRMIAHALGQRINSNDQAPCYEAGGRSNVQVAVDDIGRRMEVNLGLHSRTSVHSNMSTVKNVKCYSAQENDGCDCSLVAHDETLSRNSAGVGHRPTGKNGLVTSKLSMREENLGAAKRMFAHALGRPTSKDGISRGK